jgi:hypothetical protein
VAGRAQETRLSWAQAKPEGAQTLSELWKYIAALLPTAGLLYLFYVVMKHILEADRRERAAVREWEAAQDSPNSQATDIGRD